MLNDYQIILYIFVLLAMIISIYLSLSFASFSSKVWIQLLNPIFSYSQSLTFICLYLPEFAGNY